MGTGTPPPIWTLGHTDALELLPVWRVFKVFGGAGGIEIRQFGEGLDDVVDGLGEHGALRLEVRRVGGEHVCRRRIEKSGDIGQGRQRYATLASGEIGLPASQQGTVYPLSQLQAAELFGHLLVGPSMNAGQPLLHLRHAHRLCLLRT